MTERRGSARAKLLSAAGERFYAQGVTATGIDTIVADAGVAKMSLYNNFASKADLVAAYLEQRHEEFLEVHRRRVEALAPDAGARERVLAVFDAYLDFARRYGPAFRGCVLLNVAGELPTGDPAREAVARQKAEVEQLLLAAVTGPQDAGPDHHLLAEHLSMLLEGALVRAGLEGDDGRLRRARDLAAALVASATAA